MSEYEKKVKSIIRHNSIKKKQREKIAKMTRRQRQELFFGRGW